MSVQTPPSVTTDSSTSLHFACQLRAPPRARKEADLLQLSVEMRRFSFFNSMDEDLLREVCKTLELMVAIPDATIFNQVSQGGAPPVVGRDCEISSDSVSMKSGQIQVEYIFEYLCGDSCWPVDHACQSLASATRLQGLRVPTILNVFPGIAIWGHACRVLITTAGPDDDADDADAPLQGDEAHLFYLILAGEVKQSSTGSTSAIDDANEEEDDRGHSKANRRANEKVSTYSPTVGSTTMGNQL
eukprot:1193253-Prorocentrum_minimum.AAC.3